MRTTSIFTISLPPFLAKEVEKGAKNESMTRSEFLRAAVRSYIEKKTVDYAVKIARDEYRTGKTKILAKGGLVKMLS